MFNEKYDIIVIGGGPGGYVAAIKAAQLNLKVACIEKRGALGGTCLNVGCIPSKTLLNSSHKYAEAKKDFAKLGIKVSGISLDLATMMQNKEEVVGDLNKGIEGLFRKNKVDHIKGTAKIKNNSEVEVILQDGTMLTLQYRNIIIATGSESTAIPGVEIDEKMVVSSTGALSLKVVPRKMIVVGGGYIGLEMGSVWNDLGSDVTVIEYADRILPAMDGDISKEATKILTKHGLKFLTSTKLISVKKEKDQLIVLYQGIAEGEISTMQSDVVLIAVGRKPYTIGLGLENVGITLDTKGCIPVNEHLQTSVPNIYAVGDVVTGPMLAHKAAEEGVTAVEYIAGQKPHINYNLIPGVVYLNPEIASVGLTEDQVKKAGMKYRVSKFPFAANSRARTSGQTDGFVKVITEEATDRVIGAHIIGPNAGEIIMSIAVGMEYSAASEDYARMCFPHPALCEAVKEAALGAYSKPIHL